MTTQVINAQQNPEAGTQLGAKILRDGGLVAFPTETVYGLGANGLDEAAVRGIYDAKGRPSDNPLILHVSAKSEVRALWDDMPKTARILMDTFWPGPLTLIAPRAKIVPDVVTGGLDTVAVRMPANKTARALIQRAGVPVAAPSANLSGKPSPTTAEHVLQDMYGRIPLIIDGGPCRYGVESTVLSLCGVPTILRPGAITQEMLSAVIGEVRVADSILSPLEDGVTAASPGMKYKHYAPQAEVIVVSGAPKQAAQKICSLYDAYENQGKRVQILSTLQTNGFYNHRDCVILGNRDHPETLCMALFSALRDADKRADIILAEGIPATHAGLAYMNRLLRAAGFQVIPV